MENILVLSRRRDGLLRRILEQIYSWVPNSMWTTAGKTALTAAWVALNDIYIQMGTGGATDPLVGDTTLQTAANESRVQATVTVVTSTTCRAVATTTCSTPATWNETGSFDAPGAGNPAVGGNMFIHSNDFGGAVAVLAGDQVSMTIDAVHT